MDRPIAALCSVLLAGCGGGAITVVDPAIPAEVEWVGLLFEHADGAAIASTGLERLVSHAETEIRAGLVDDGARVTLVAYGANDLGAGAPAEDVLRAGRVSRASPEDPLLPAPRWASAGTLDGGRADLSPLAAPPALSASWLARCPRILGDAGGYVVPACATSFCETRVTQLACDLEIEAQGCGVLADLAVRVDGHGRIHAGGSALYTGCQQREAPLGAAAGFECIADSERCVVEVIANPTERRFETEAVGVAESPRGLDDLIVLARRVGVTSVIPAADASRCSTEVRLHFFDLETLQQTDEVGAPDCLSLMARDPLGDGFVAVYGPARETLGRFDASGRLLASAPAPAIGGRSAVSDLAFAGTSTRVIAIVRKSAVSGTPAILTLHDAATLRQKAMSQPFGRHPRSIAVLPGDRIAVADDESDVLFVFDARTGSQITMIHLRAANRGVNAEVTDVLQHPPSGRVLVANAAGIQGALWSMDLDAAETTFGRVVLAERGAAPVHIDLWPADPRFVLVVLQAFGDPVESLIALADPSIPRFLPGALAIGRGPAGVPEKDDAGRVWLPLTRNGRLVRVTAKGQ